MINVHGIWVQFDIQKCYVFSCMVDSGEMFQGWCIQNPGPQSFPPLYPPLRSVVVGDSWWGLYSRQTEAHGGGRLVMSVIFAADWGLWRWAARDEGYIRGRLRPMAVGGSWWGLYSRQTEAYGGGRLVMRVIFAADWGLWRWAARDEGYIRGRLRSMVVGGSWWGLYSRQTEAHGGGRLYER